MASAWTAERRQAQACRIRDIQPWRASTGPRTAEGKARASRNAWKGGARPAARRMAKAMRIAMSARLGFGAEWLS